MRKFHTSKKTRDVKFKPQNKDRHHKQELFSMRKEFNKENELKIRKCNKCNLVVYWRVNTQMNKYLAEYPSNKRHNCVAKVKTYTKKEIEMFVTTRNGELNENDTKKD